MIHILIVISLSLLIGPGRPFDLVVFEDRLWITDREQQLLLSVDKRTGMNPERLHGNMVQPASIVVVHPLAKPGSKKSERERLHNIIVKNLCLLYCSLLPNAFNCRPQEQMFVSIKMGAVLRCARAG